MIITLITTNRRPGHRWDPHSKATPRRANTRRAYEGALRRLRDWLDGRSLDDATLAEYLAARFEAGHSPAVAGRVPARRTATGPGAGGGRPLGAGGRRRRGGPK